MLRARPEPFEASSCGLQAELSCTLSRRPLVAPAMVMP